MSEEETGDDIIDIINNEEPVKEAIIEEVKETIIEQNKEASTAIPYDDVVSFHTT